MKKFNHLTVKQLNDLKKRMLEDKERIIESHKLQDAGFFINKDDQSDEVDLANSDYNSSHMLRMRNRDIFYIKKIDSALKKFDSKEYGYCEDCGSEIKFQRLSARPTANLCIVCKEESELDEQKNLFGNKSQSYTEAVDLSAK